MILAEIHFPTVSVMQVSWLYNNLSRFDRLSYRAKIMLMAFVGSHIPLIALACYLALQTAPDWQIFLTTVGVTLLATLVGTALTLLVLHQLLQPIVLTSNALRRYRETRQKLTLPTGYTDEVGVLMADADAAIDHLEQARDTLEHIDEVTNLPNRKKLLQLMDMRARLGLTFSVSVIRFSNFSRIAEAVSLAQADRAAGHLAVRLESHVAPGSVVARIGQSDFALFRAHRDDGADESTVILDRLRALIDQCGEVLPLDATEIKPELRCGVARYPHDANNAETVLDHAIASAAQATASLPVMLHSAEARQVAFRRLTIEQQLRRAVEKDEFFLCYQPVVDIQSGRVNGAEALIRWRHPDQGLILPDDFIPAAEASGLIVPIGRWVVREACEQLRRWNATDLHGMRIAINLSARQFLNPNLGSELTQAIDSAGIDAHQVELELTETSAMHDISYSRHMLSKLRDLGVTIAIDDFGTGYGSMSYLRQLAFDKLKIDREFVTDVHQRSDSQAICRSLVALSQGLGLNVVAEGTEKAEEVQFLRTEGCSLFQGYFFAKPLSARDFEVAYRELPAALARNHRALEGQRTTLRSVG